MKITMIGASGSGKTSYMSALHDSLTSDSPMGFQINPAGYNIDENMITKGIWSSLRGGKFPNATYNTTLWSFDLKHNGKFVCNFEMMDYRGELLSVPSGELSNKTAVDDFNELLSHIAISDAVIIFADSFLLSQDSLDKARISTGAQTINTILSTLYGTFPQKELIFVIALTKVDMVESKWKQNDYQPLIMRGLEIFSPLVNICRKNPAWIGGIVPISVLGEGNAKYSIERPENLLSLTEITSVPRPLNVMYPLFFCLQASLTGQARLIQKDFEQRTRNLEKALKQSSLLRKMWSFLTKEPSAENITKALVERQQSEYLSLRQYESYLAPLFASANSKVEKIL